MKVLVTGATGFLGRNLTVRLLKEGHEVAITGRSERVGKTLEEEGAIFEKAQLEDSDAISGLCRHKDVVFHCAALCSPWGNYRDFYSSNVIGTKNVIHGCKINNVSRLVNVSTSSVYFNHKNQINISEKDKIPPRQVNHYASTKLFAENEIDKAFNEGLPTITIRPHAIFGPYDNNIMPRILRVHKNGKLPLIGKGDNIVEITYVGNVVDALILSMNAPYASLGNKYNITNGEPMLLRELLEMVFHELGIPFSPIHIPYNLAFGAAIIMEALGSLPFIKNEPIVTRYSVGLFSKSFTFDISAAKRDLGYKPSTTTQQGIKKYARWWKARDDCMLS